MDSSILIAIVTAITSIMIALIQATVSLRVARAKEPPVQPIAVPIVPVQSSAPVKTLSANRTWLWIGSLLVISNFLWPLYLSDESGYLVPLGAIPWCTCLLAYFRPIRWAYIAGVVTLINAISLAILYIKAQGWYVDLDLTTVSLFYIANAVLAAGIGYLRQRNSTTT